MTRFGQHWRDVDREAARTDPEALQGRLVELNKRLEACTDPVAQTEFARAREALSAQVESLQEISRGRERAIARLTHQVAMLERLRLAALRHRSVDASRMGAELQPVVEELSQAGTDLDIASEALSEATTAAALPPAGHVH
jgi:chromosome segregation ATPase